MAKPFVDTQQRKTKGEALCKGKNKVYRETKKGGRILKKILSFCEILNIMSQKGGGRRTIAPPVCCMPMETKVKPPVYAQQQKKRNHKLECAWKETKFEDGHYRDLPLFGIFNFIDIKRSLIMNITVFLLKKLFCYSIFAF